MLYLYAKYDQVLRMRRREWEEGQGKKKEGWGSGGTNYQAYTDCLVGLEIIYIRPGTSMVSIKASPVTGLGIILPAAKIRNAFCFKSLNAFSLLFHFSFFFFF